jgi:putative peptidoglycan lipid II flippase
VRILFQRGRFDPAATTLTAEVLVWFLAGAFAFAAYTVVVRGFYATRNTLTPALFGTVAVLASLPVYFLGMSLMETSGVAAAVSLSGILQVAVLYHLWSRRSGNAGQGGVYGFYLKMGLLGVGMAAALSAFRELLLEAFDAASLTGSLAVAALVGLTFAGLMLLAGYGLKIPEITDHTGRLVQAVQRKFSKGRT